MTNIVPTLLDKLTEEHRTLVEKGVYSVHPGDSYPVLRWAAGARIGQLAPGTGISPNHADSAAIGRSSAWKRTNEYQDLLRRYLPADLDDTKRGTLGWILKQGMDAIEGVDLKRRVACNQCGHEQTVTMAKRPDGNVLIKMLELLVGRAPEQKDININSEQMYRIIDERRDMRDLVIYEVSPAEEERREAIDAEWRDADGET